MKKFVQHIQQELQLFLIPCVLWYIIGGILLIIKTRSELFFPINSYHTSWLNVINDVCSAYGRGDVIAILLVFFLIHPYFRNKQYILTALLFGIIIPTLIYFTKSWFDQPRPISYYGIQQVSTVPWLENYLNNSFPSGHTLGAFGFFTLLSFFLPAKQKKWSLLFFGLALCVGFSRIYLGQHFFRDIYAGSIAGVCVTIIIYFVVDWILLKNKTS